MFAEQNLVPVHANLVLDLGRDPKLVHHPGNHRLAEQLVGLRIALQRHHQDAVEFAEWLLEENHIVEIPAGDAGGIEAELYGLLGKVEVVLLAGKAFFFGRGDQRAIVQQHGGCVMVIATDS